MWIQDLSADFFCGAFPPGLLRGKNQRDQRLFFRKTDFQKNKLDLPLGADRLGRLERRRLKVPRHSHSRRDLISRWFPVIPLTAAALAAAASTLLDKRLTRSQDVALAILWIVGCLTSTIYSLINYRRGRTFALICILLGALLLLSGILPPLLHSPPKRF